MKTKTTLLALLFLSLNYNLIFAQASALTTGCAPALGDVFTFYTATASSLDTSIGANKIWDYSSLSISSNTKVESYVSPASLDGAACGSAGCASSVFVNGTNQLNATMALQDINLNFIYYYALSGNTFYKTGYVSPGFLIRGDGNLQKMITYPFAYGTSQTDTYQDMDGNGTSTVVADGWGTLKLPSSVTYNNVLRVKYRDVFYETASGALWSDVTYHDWYDGVHKQPVLRIIENYGVISKVLTFASGPNITAGMGVPGLSASENQFKIYPSPANEKTTLSYTVTETNSDVTISFYTVLGTKVKTENRQNLNAGTYTEEMNVRDLAKGIYIVDLNINNASSRSKLIIE
ncbi:MAG: T9SS type A sorting domain-containing protein [Bacteroidetes bacterium]|nr:T9SS type A sorting domain-containing protein [Bacteroidota bacterium]